MLHPNDALAALNRPSPRRLPQPRRALVVGAGGSLGSAVMEQLLAQRRFQAVGALVDQPMKAALAGFVAVLEGPQSLHAFDADTALVVFDRARDGFRREAAFRRPMPDALPALAARLRDAGVRYLVVVVPHKPGLLPLALQQGLATLDEAAVAALGFEQLVFMRLPQASTGADIDPVHPLPSKAQRLAHWMLGQLHWMVPQGEQAVRLATVAKVSAALAWQLPAAVSATRVLPSKLLWHAAQQRDVQDTVQAWLSRSPWPAVVAKTKWRL